MAGKMYAKTAAKMVGAKLAPAEIEKLQELVNAGQYLNISDFVRDAIKEKLEGIEIIKLRDIDYKTAKKEVLGYFEKFKEAYPSDAADDLGIELETVYNITRELIKGKRLEVIQ